ncbi:amino acid permease-associated region [Methanosalsum zhilinae DSM 4017]|uniref:Amino acid permease-associated region n=1 Tax=Methanosalsum zhilinae (strain DSM 4017 / NBRC 107636 / OCM 62 / WeN5) TaxID=679901 RepID=F7XPE0_METZD|nr:APC family permease [Methanosalsum zhilinae]AEH60268.1 amino acid permease-associated region [Methanosalsum zhilinae DSM 4017]
MGEDIKLKRELGILEITLIGVGSILGAGIYVLIGAAAGLAGNAVWVSFLIASMVAGLTGFSYMELSSMYPLAGAEYEYAKTAFGERTGLTVGLLIVVVEIVACSTVALGFAGYLTSIMDISGSISIAIAVMHIIFFALILLMGIKYSARIAIFLTVIQISGLFLVIFLGLPLIGSVNYFGIPSIDGIFEASALVFFAFLGFEEVVKLAQETREPVYNTPRALILSIVITVILYISVAVSAVSVVDWKTLSESSAPLAEVAAASLGNDAFIVLSVIALFATSNTVLLMLLGGSRILYGMADSRSLPAKLAYIHPVRRTPAISIFIIAVISIVFVFIVDIEAAAKISNFMMFIVFIVINACLIKLRYTHPDSIRKFKVPLCIGKFPIIPFAGIIMCLFLLSHLDITALIYGISILFLLLLLVFYLKRKKDM